MKNILTASILLVSLMLAAAAPVAVVKGGQHGASDAKRLVYRVLLPNEWIYREFDEFLDPADFKNFAAVIWFSGSREMDEAQLKNLKRYLENGGTVIFTGSSISGIVKRQFKQHPFLGIAGWRYSGKDKYFENIAWQKPDHPILTGVDTTRIPEWAPKAFYAVKPTASGVSLLGNSEGWSILTEIPVGKGKLYYLWEGLFRIANAAGKPESVSAEQIIANILRAAKPQTTLEDLNQHAAKDKLLLWQRDWQEIPQAGPAFIPPYPEAGEIIEKLDFFSAINERDTQFIVCQSLTGQNISIKAPGKPFSLYISAKPPVIPSLVPKKLSPEAAELCGAYYLTPLRDEFVLKPGKPEIIWIKVDTAGLAPGVYHDKLEIGNRSIPLNLTVYPIVMPENRPVVFRFWGSGPPLREPFISTLKENNFELWLAPRLKLNELTCRETGTNLRDAAGKEPEKFLKEPFPALEFPASYRNDILAAASAGFSYVRFYTGAAGRQLAERVLKRKLPEKMADWPPEAQRIFSGLYGEYARFLNEHGFYDIDAVWLDEPSIEEINNKYLTQAELLNRAGIGNAVTWTGGALDNPERAAKLALLCSTWDTNLIIAGKMKNLQVPAWHPRSKFGLCASGNGFNSRRSPGDGRAFARNLLEFGHKFRFVSIGPFWKEWIYYADYDAGDKNQPQGIDGERMMAYGDLKKQTLLTSPFLEGMRDGIDEMNLLWMLEWYADRLGNTDIAAKREQWHRELNFTDKIYGTRKQRDYRAIDENMPSVKNELFKKQLLDALMEVKETVKPEYFWDNQPITGVKIVDRTGGNHQAAIRRIVPTEGNLTLNIEQKQQAPAGDFKITRDGLTVTVTGNDAAGTALGVQAFINNLRAYGTWLR